MKEFVDQLICSFFELKFLVPTKTYFPIEFHLFVFSLFHFDSLLFLRFNFEIVCLQKNKHFTININNTPEPEVPFDKK